MEKVLCYKADSNGVLIRLEKANNFLTRLIGLLGRLGLKRGHGIWFLPGGSIHTVGMLFNIDVVFLNKEMEICKISPRVPPFRLRLAPKHTETVIELASGQAQELGLRLGDKLLVSTDFE